FETQTAGQYALGEGRRELPDAFSVRRKKTVASIVKDYGLENCPEIVRNLISCPSNIIVPLDACCKPAAMVSNVLFPEPDAPASAVISPLFKERLIPFKTCSSTSPFVNDFCNVSAVNSAILHLSLLNCL